MIVPTLTRFGRVREWTLLDSKRGALVDDVTVALLRVRGERSRGGRRVVCQRMGCGRPTADGAGGPGERRRYDADMTAQTSDPVTVVVYSNQPEVRAAVRLAVGRRPAPDVPRIDWVECTTSAEVVEQIDRGEVDLVILDGEAQPTGGMGLARQFKYEIDDCPPIMVLIARRDDAWLASWSLADGVITAPLDPVAAAEAVAEQLRKRLSGVPVVR